MSKLANKIALVTGASRGIGRAAALALAAEGAKVIIHYSSGRPEAEAVAAQITDGGGSAIAIGTDLSTPDGPHKLAALVREAIGDRLDILIANAGVSKAAKIEDLTVEDFDWLYAINVRAPYFLVQQLLPLLGEGSSITFVTSVVARTAVGNLSAYAATKGAISSLIKHFAAILGPKGIRVNGIAPGIIDTDMSNFARTDEGRDFAISIQALKRLGKPDDVGAAFAFLATADARWITGDILEVSGGSKI